MERRYYAPTTLAEALRLVAELGDEVGIVAGGTDLVVANRSGKKPLPPCLVAISGLTELSGIEEVDGDVRIGALASHGDLELSPHLRERYSALSDAAALIGSPATRHVGTLGGNLCNASPAMDTGSPLLVLDATVELASAAGSRTLPLEEFLVGPDATALAVGELLAAVLVPPLPQGRTGSAYLRLDYRRAMEIAVVGAAALVALDGDGHLSETRLALTAVAPTCMRVPAAKADLRGRMPTPELLAQAGESAADASQPIDDVRAPASYRRAMVAVIARRALELALRRAQGEQVPIPAARVLEVA